MNLTLFDEIGARNRDGRNLFCVIRIGGFGGVCAPPPPAVGFVKSRKEASRSRF